MLARKDMLILKTSGRLTVVRYVGNSHDVRQRRRWLRFRKAIYQGVDKTPNVTDDLPRIHLMEMIIIYIHDRMCYYYEK